MPRFLNTTGRSTLGIALCARCSRKFSLEDLFPDPNSPGLMVCRKDLDDLDPYRLPPREPDQINLLFVRPDVSLTDLADSFTLTLPLLGTEGLDYVITQNGDYIELEGI